MVLAIRGWRIRNPGVAVLEIVIGVEVWVFVFMARFKIKKCQIPGRLAVQAGGATKSLVGKPPRVREQRR